jgi:hypothetical protein
VKHDPRGLLWTVVKDGFQNLHHEFHGRVVVVVQENLIKRWLREFLLGPRLWNRNGTAAPWPILLCHGPIF